MKNKLIALLLALLLLPSPLALAVKHPLAQAYDMITEKKFSEAENLLNSFKADQTYLGYQLYLLGLCYSGKKEYSKALELLDKALLQLPDLSEIYLSKLQALHYEKNYQAFFTFLPQVKEHLPDNKFVINEELAVYLELNLYHSALNLIEHLPDSAELSYLRCQLLMAVHDYDRALNYAEIYSYKYPENLQLKELKIHALTAKGFYLQAATELENSFYKNPGKYASDLQLLYQFANLPGRATFFQNFMRFSDQN